MEPKFISGKKNYFYFDWPFGGYVFDAIFNCTYSEINLVKFSLFDIFNVSSRQQLATIVAEDILKPLDSSKVKQFIFENKNKIQGFLITHDWLKYTRNLIDVFREFRIPTILILHEGVFQDEKVYYNGLIPCTDKAFVWGELHQNIFVNRGYSMEKIYKVGSIKLNSYKNFKPEISRKKFFQITGLMPDKKIILYCAQFCDIQWGDQKFALEKQRHVIRDIVKISLENDYNVIIRNAPPHPETVLPKSFIQEFCDLKNVYFEGSECSNTLAIYSMSASDNICYSDLVVGMNTTMQIEASLLNKPSIIVKYFDFMSKWNIEAGLPVATNYDELQKLINDNINKHDNLICSEKREEFYKNYGYSDSIDFNPLKNILNLL